MFRVLQRVQERLYPNATTLPIMLTGGTDMKPLRAKGVQAYGLGPLVEESKADTNGAHADDERIRESSLHMFVEYLWNVVLETGAVR